MRFYRNLGPICFEGQTNAFQIFSAQPSTYLFQPKQSIQSANLFQQIAVFYDDYLHTANFKSYQQSDKEVSFVISGCKQKQLSQMDCNSLCSWMLQATKIVQKVSVIVPDLIGDFSATQFFTLGNRKVFVYIPAHPTKNALERQRLQIQGLANLANSVKAERDMSQQLLTKKLAKCKTLQEVIQQLTYFSNIYGYGINKKYEKLMKLEQSTLGKRSQKNDKSKRKFNLFQLDMKRSKQTFYSHHQNNYISSEPRKSCTAIHISMPQQKKMPNSLHTSSHRQLRPFSPSRRSSKNQQSMSNLKNSKLRESIEIKDKDKEKLSKKAINKESWQNYSVNQKDQQKLFKRLQNRKKESKLNQIDFTKSVGIQSKAVEQPQIKEEKKVKQVEQTLPQKQVIKEITNKQPIQLQISQQKQQKKEKENIKQKRESINISHREYTKQASKNSIRHESPRLSKSRKTIAHQIGLVTLPSKNTPKKQQPLAPLPLVQSSLPTKCNNQPEKKLKKKKIPVKTDEVCHSQLEIIDLDVKQKPLKPQPKQKPSQEIYNQTRKNSFNQQIASQMQQTKRLYQKQPTLQQKLNQRLKNVDFMGIAVANTIGHLAGYQNIFWQLPMFFIYRAFYLERVQIFEKLQRLPYVTSPLKEMKDQNTKICQSVTKLIKIIIKKLKKDDLPLLNSVKAFLSLDSKIDCREPMKVFLKEYIMSLEQAIKSKYSELTLHLLEIIDAYLIFFGQSIDFPKRSKAQTSKQQMNQYLSKQLKILKTYC